MWGEAGAEAERIWKRGPGSIRDSNMYNRKSWYPPSRVLLTPFPGRQYTCKQNGADKWGERCEGRGGERDCGQHSVTAFGLGERPPLLRTTSLKDSLSNGWQMG